MYRTAFDLSENLPWDLVWIGAIGVAFTLVGVLLLRVVQDRVPPWFTIQAANMQEKGPLPKWVPWLWLSLTAIAVWSLGVQPGVRHWRARQALSTRTFQVIEGRVEELNAGPTGRSPRATFRVGSVRFVGSDVEAPLAHMNAQGTLIHDGLAVRITYLAEGGHHSILKLEIDKNEPVKPAKQEPPMSMESGVLASFCIAGFLANVWFHHRDGNAALKRRWFVPYVVASTLFFALFLASFSDVPRFLLAVFAGSSLLSFRSTAICDCGRAVRARRFWHRPTECNQCGTTLTPDSQPWLRWL